jgi:hypothetical protein
LYFNITDDKHCALQNNYQNSIQLELQSETRLIIINNNYATNKREKRRTNRKGIDVKVFFFERVWIVAAHCMKEWRDLENRNEWSCYSECVIFVCSIDRMHTEREGEREIARWNLRFFRLPILSLYSPKLHTKDTLSECKVKRKCFMHR